MFFVSIVFLLISGTLASASQQINEIKIFPSSYDERSEEQGSRATVRGSYNEMGWQNSQAAFIQNLDEKADFIDFNQENSAYISELPILGSTTSTESVLEFFDFSVAEELKETKIKNAQLRFSLAGKPHETTLNGAQNHAKLVILNIRVVILGRV